MGAKVTYRRIRGKIVPIKNAESKRPDRAPSRVAESVDKLATTNKSHVAPKRTWQALGTASAVGAGILSGLTIFGPRKAFVLGQSASFGLDIVSSASNVAAYAGKGRKVDRAKGIARGEAINQIAGYSAMGATILANPYTRGKAVDYSVKAYRLARSYAGAIGNVGKGLF